MIVLGQNMKNRKGSKFCLLLFTVLLFVFFSFQNQSQQFDLFNLIYKSNINLSNNVSVYLSNIDLIFNLILVSVSSETDIDLQIYPETLNDQIFSIIDKTKIIQLVSDNQLSEDVTRSIGSLSSNDSVLLYSDLFNYFLMSYSVRKSEIEYKPDVVEKLNHLYKWFSYDLYLQFLDNFNVEIGGICNYLSQYVEGNIRADIDKISSLNYSLLKPNRDLKILLRTLVGVANITKNDEDGIDEPDGGFPRLIEFSSYNSVNKSYYDFLFSSVDFYSDDFYENNIKPFEGDYINLFIPPEDKISEFYCTLNHEFFHFYQDDFNSSSFVKNLSDYVGKDEELKSLLENYFTKTDDLSSTFIEKLQEDLNNEKIDSKEFMLFLIAFALLANYEYGFLNFDESNFQKLYYNAFFTSLFSGVTSFLEFSADFYGLWITKKYFSSQISDYSGYPENKSLLNILNTEFNILNLDIINDFSIWVEIFRHYLKFCIENVSDTMLYNIFDLMKKSLKEQ